MYIAVGVALFVQLYINIGQGEEQSLNNPLGSLKRRRKIQNRKYIYIIAQEENRKNSAGELVESLGDLC